jgi:chromosome segregation ATPase
MANRLEELQSKCAELKSRLDAGEEELQEAEHDLWCLEEALNGIEITVTEAEKHIWDAITRLEYLQNDLQDAGLNNAAAQLEAYMIPHLMKWLEDEDQPGSLAMVKRRVKKEFGLDLE